MMMNNEHDLDRDEKGFAIQCHAMLILQFELFRVQIALLAKYFFVTPLKISDSVDIEQL